MKFTVERAAKQRMVEQLKIERAITEARLATESENRTKESYFRRDRHRTTT
jgi:hypothetical protein